MDNLSTIIGIAGIAMAAYYGGRYLMSSVTPEEKKSKRLTPKLVTII